MATSINRFPNVPLVRTRKRPLHVPVLFMTIFALVSIVACEWALNSTTVSLPCGICIGVLAFPLVMYRTERTPIAPIYLTALFIFIAYPIRLLAVRMYLPGVFEDYRGRLFDDAAVTLVLWMLSLALLAYYIGYYRAPKFLIKFVARIRLPVTTEINSQWYLRAIFVSMIGWGCFLFQVSAQTWSSFAGLGDSWDPRYNQLLSYLFNYVWYGMIAAAVWLSYRNLKRTWLGISVTTALIGFTVLVVLFLMGSKTWLMAPFVYLFSVLYMNRRRVPFWLMASVTFVVMIFAFTFIPQYRTNYAEWVRDLGPR